LHSGKLFLCWTRRYLDGNFQPAAVAFSQNNFSIQQFHQPASDYYSQFVYVCLSRGVLEVENARRILEGLALIANPQHKPGAGIYLTKDVDSLARPAPTYSPGKKIVNNLPQLGLVRDHRVGARS
jgi:hypothetical protein